MSEEQSPQDAPGPRILSFATQGSEHLDAQRLRYLLEPLGAEEFEFDRGRRLRSALGLMRAAGARRAQLIVMEGTGVAGGLAVLALRLRGIPFVISSGDAVGPYIGLRSRLAGLLAGAYERILCRRCAGFIGWTPYLVGRALTYGAPRAMTAAGWPRERARAGARERIRELLGIPPQALVVGIVGSLNWRRRLSYGYGAELVRAVRLTQREDLVACIVGDGAGTPVLRELAGEELGARIVMAGRVAPEEVGDYLAAFDLASLPQSVDKVGSFRYSTKLSEYLAAGLPVITGQIPAAYDLDDGCFWRLPGPAPWSETYVRALAQLLEQLAPDALAEHRAAAVAHSREPFDREAQQRRTRDFIADILSSTAP